MQIQIAIIIITITIITVMELQGPGLVPFKMLRQILPPTQTQTTPNNSQTAATTGWIRPYFDFYNKPFWIWDREKHEKQYNITNKKCCFNHVVGLPQRRGQYLPLFDYEHEVLQALEKSKLVWIKKARGLGISELMLRWMLWLALKDNTLKNAQMAIITGPRLELAVDLMKRMKKIIAPYYQSQERETMLTINGCSIRAYPSNANTSRGQENMAVIFMDEADYFDGNEAEEAKIAAEGYILKSRPWIVMVSTPNKPAGFFDTIEKDTKSPYTKIFLPYNVGLGKIYNTEELAAAQRLSSFEREYNLKYSTTEGNIFPYYLVDQITRPYSLQHFSGDRVLALDPAFGSSKFAIIGIEKMDGINYVKIAQQHKRPSPAAMLELVVKLAKNYNYSTVLVDSAHAGLITDLNLNGINAGPVIFNKTLSDMVFTAVAAVKEQKIAIHPCFSELLAQLKTVTFNPKGHPDKRQLSFDLGDALLMALHYMQTSVFAYARLPDY